MNAVLAALWANRKSRLGLAVLAVFVLVALIGPGITPYPVSDTHFPDMLGPTPAHWLGTTQSGQDVLSELIAGARVSVAVTFAVGLISTALSLAVGAVAGYAGGLVDEVLSFGTNVFLVLPGLPLLVVLASYAPSRGLLMVVSIVALTSWPWGARMLRSQVMSLRTRDFVSAAKLTGDSHARILLREVVPHMGSLIAASFLGASLAGLLAAVGLEFLGFGNPDVVSWGSMLYWAQNSDALLNGQWAWIVAPGLCIALLGTSMVLVNFGLDEIANPELRRETA